MAAAPAMNHKIFLPMGEKPPNKFDRGRDASGNQASIVTPFPPECQILKEFLALRPAILSSTTHKFVVVIFVAQYRLHQMKIY
jgi:hypothetical protein